MKFRIVLFIILAISLSACNLTLAEDVTPPPGYIPPTPVPTLVLVPPQTPNVAIGEAIYFEKCAACHGDAGFGEGDQGIQLGVTVPAFALPEVARPASPSAWYTTVTRGRMDRFMPPFASLNDQERWDVVAYIMTLHTTEDEIQKGKEIFEANCANCSTDFYKDPGKMSGLSTVELARIVRLGNEEILAFGENLSDDEMWAVAEYLRSLSYDSTFPSDLASAEETPPVMTTPVEAEGTSVTNEAASPSIEGRGTVSGSIENKTKSKLPDDLSVTLRGYEHDLQDPNTGPQEVVTIASTVESDGSFAFENVEIPEGRIFLAEVNYKGIDYSSDFMIVKAGQTSLRLLPLVIYDMTHDLSRLVIDEMDLFLTVTTEGSYEILTLYSFRNIGEAVVYVKMKDSQEIPFLRFPVGTQGIGYEALQDSAPFTNTADGFAMPPSEVPYGIIAYSSVVSEKDFTISQSLDLPVSVARVFVPAGMKAGGNQLIEDTTQDIQGELYQVYIASNLQAGETLSLDISGSPSSGSTSPNTTTLSSSLLIGAGGLGIALILAGAWMYLRDKTQSDEDDGSEEGEFETTENLLDAIIVLDELHRAKKISGQAYQNRRDELKELLKEMM